MTSILHKEMSALEKQLLTLTAMVDENVQLSFQALVRKDTALAEKLIKADDEIDRMEVALEEECLKILALHQPVASDLRMIVAVLKINNNLERIADLATNIAERARAVAREPEAVSPLKLDEMARKVIAMLGKALDSLVDADLETAENVLELDEEVDQLHVGNYQLFKDFLRDNPEKIDMALNYLTVSRHLERIADLATNIAEDVIYLNEGRIVRHTIA